jgi:hypothetical protein
MALEDSDTKSPIRISTCDCDSAITYIHRRVDVSYKGATA